MPIFDHTYIDPRSVVPASQHLQAAGPLLPVEIHVPTIVSTALVNLGLPVPNPVVGLGLIDTGASITAVKEAILTG
jgi:hypothetical protein